MSNTVPEPTPTTRADSVPAKVWKHFIIHRGFYILLPIFVLLMLGAIRGVYWLTGRPPTDDPGVLVALCYNAIVCAVAIALATFVKAHGTLNRPSNGALPSGDDLNGDGITDWKELLISRASTFALLALFLYFLKN